ncbi:MAG: hypothetical protein IT445_02085 [Phycisphaeraceae bacterium]|nr:hypothetical protein [Phycisphaeraceae bacterium]
MPDVVQTPALQARAVYGELAALLEAEGARIFCERIFATAEAMPVVITERKVLLGDLDDGIAPTRIIVTPGQSGALACVQIHAIQCAQPPRKVRCGNNGHAGGRELRLGDDRWLMLSRHSADVEQTPRRQARLMFQEVADMLRATGTDMHSVARTWLWLDNICAWYGDLNAERTEFFQHVGLINTSNHRPRLPASTGIGLSPAGGGACAIDLIALPGAAQRIELLEAGGEQNSAFSYGSAFSRAAVAPMPGGATLFISGTAAIDRQGRSENLDDAQAQIDHTLNHVRALLAQVGCGDSQVLAALAYCKTPRVEQLFQSRRAALGWPVISMVGQVCRPELLFEVEVAAGPVNRDAAKDSTP